VKTNGHRQIQPATSAQALSGILPGVAASAMGSAPLAHGLEERGKAAAVVADGVFDFGRDLRIHLSLDQAVAFELSKLCGDHFLR